MFKSILRGTFLRFLPGVLTIGTLSAATIDSNTVAYDLGSGTFNGAYTQFNPSLGTLNSVALGLTDTSSFTVNVSNSGAGTVSISADFDYGGDVNIPGYFFADYINNVDNTIFCTGTGSCSSSVPHLNGGSGTNTIGVGAFLSSYIGLGTVAFSIAPDQAITNIVSTGTNPQASFSPGLDIFGNTFLQYTYTPTVGAVPEPGTIALTAAGLGLLALLGRRLRRSSSH